PRVRTPKLVHFGATHGADGVPHVRHNHVLDPSTLPCSAMLQQAEQYPSRRSREPASMRSTTHLASSRALSTTSFLFLSASSSPESAWDFASAIIHRLLTRNSFFASSSSPSTTGATASPPPTTRSSRPCGEVSVHR